MHENVLNNKYRTKRYFQGFRENEANKLYRIAVYSYDRVDSLKLIERLVAL